MKGRKEEFFQVPKDAPFQVTRPGEAYIKGVGIRRLENMDQYPLYCRVIVPARVPKNTGLNLFTAADDSDLMVTNIPRGNRLSVGAEAVIYRIRLGVAPEADLTVGDIMGVLSAGVMELGICGDRVTVKSPLMMLPFTLFPGEDPQEFMEICDSDKRMGLKGMLADPIAPTSTTMLRMILYDQTKRAIPIHVAYADEDSVQFRGQISFGLQGKNDRPVWLYLIMDSLLLLPLR